VCEALPEYFDRPLDLQSFFERIKYYIIVVVIFFFCFFFSLLKSVNLLITITTGAGELIDRQGF